MTEPTLDPARLQLVEAILELGFGRIEQISIRDGKPYFERATRVVQEIKIDSQAHRRSDPGANLTLKKEFQTLFDQLDRLSDDIVDIEVRHSLPFKLVLELRYQKVLP